MLTVREACTLINNPKEVDVAVNGNAYSLFHNGAPDYDDVMVEVFGDYIVKNIFCGKEDCFELEVKMRPVKKGDMA